MKKIQQKSKPKLKASSPHLSQLEFIFVFFVVKLFYYFIWCLYEKDACNKHI